MTSLNAPLWNLVSWLGSWNYSIILLSFFSLVISSSQKALFLHWLNQKILCNKLELKIKIIFLKFNDNSMELKVYLLPKDVTLLEFKMYNISSFNDMIGFENVKIETWRIFYLFKRNEIRWSERKRYPYLTLYKRYFCY